MSKYIVQTHNSGKIMVDDFRVRDSGVLVGRLPDGNNVSIAAHEWIIVREVDE